MAVNTTQLRSFVRPIWQEISSLWSGVDFSFSDPLPDSSEQSEQAFFPRTAAGGSHSGINRGHFEHCC